MLLTKSLYAKRDKSDGKRILITRYWARGFKKTDFDEWVRELSPSIPLLGSYKRKEIDAARFEDLFRKEMENHKSQKTLHELAENSKTENITLLCHEPDGTMCHRHIIRDMVRTILHD